MGYLGDKVKKVHKMGVKVVDSVTKFGEKHKGKLAVAGMVGTALAHLSDKSKKQAHPQGGRIIPHTPYHQDSESPYSFPVSTNPTRSEKAKAKPFKVHPGVKGNIEILYGKREPHAKSHQVVRPPPAPTFGKSQGYGKTVTRLPGPTQQGRAEADFRSAAKIARDGRSGAETRIKHEQKSRRDKTIKGKLSNTRANAKMLSDAAKLIRGK